ncbi:MAG TPA: hypothetical protein VLA98_12770 [Solirubrobacteraceae bacterium]|nr:hypothetical protein [Solirubrobacteraceae bacterium]
MHGGARTPGGACVWRADATAAQLLRAAAGLEEIAHTCAGARRDELAALADDLRRRAFTRSRGEPLRSAAG